MREGLFDLGKGGHTGPFVRDITNRRMRFIAKGPDRRDIAEYRDKIERIRHDNTVPGEEDFLFVEVTVTDPSDRDLYRPTRLDPGVVHHQAAGVHPDPPGHCTRPTSRRLTPYRVIPNGQPRIRRSLPAPLS